MAQRHRGVINRQRRSKQRRSGSGCSQLVTDQAHVFLPGRNLHRRLAPATIDHRRAAHLKHARAARAIGNHLDDSGGIKAGTLTHQNRLGSRDVVNRHQQIGHQLHPHAVAKTTDVVAYAREAIKHLRECFDRAGIAAGVDREITGNRLRTGARKRAIEQDDAVLRKPVARAFLGGDGQGADFGGDQAFRFGGDQLIADLFQRSLRRQRQHRVARVARHFHGVGADDAAIALVAAARSRGWISAVNGEPSLDQIGRHCRPHDSHPDHAGRLE